MAKPAFPDAMMLSAFPTPRLSTKHPDQVRPKVAPEVRRCRDWFSPKRLSHDDRYEYEVAEEHAEWRKLKTAA